MDKGSKLVIYNFNELLQFDAIRVKTTIIDLNQIDTPDYLWDEKVFEYDQTWLNDVWEMFH